MLNFMHRASYPIDHWAGCSGANIQAVASADRPLCALVTALAAHHSGKKLRGTLSALSHTDVDRFFVGEFSRLNCDPYRANVWARALNGERMGTCCMSRVGGITLDAYQTDAVAAGSISGAIYSLDCGLGKTATAAAAAITASSLNHARRTRCWIFCPLNAFGAWERFRPDLLRAFKDVTILSVDSAHKYVAAADEGGVLIFDETHYLGHTNARRTKACHRIRAKFDVALCLTGTLLHGGVENALSVLDLAVPGGSLFASRWKAGEHFHCLARKQIGSRTVTSLEKPSGPNHAAFVEWISRLTIALKKDAPEVRIAFQLPEQHVHDVRLAEPWASIDDEAVAVALAELAATGELPHMQKVAHLMCQAHTDAKIDWLMEMIGSDRETQIVVFANYIDTLDKTQKALEDANISFVRVDGGVVGGDRSDCQSQFQSGTAQVFLGQQTAASISMDLFAAQISVSLDASWKPADYTQMLARTCRRGQQHETHHFDLTANKLQDLVVRRVRAAQSFDASVAEWQAAKRAVSLSTGTIP